MPRGDLGQPLTLLFSCAAETRGPLRGAPRRGPAHAIRRESRVPPAGEGGAWGSSGLGPPWWPAPRACLGLGAVSSPGQPVRHRDRRQHRLRGQAHRHQLHHLPRQQQGPAAHLGEPPRAPRAPPPPALAAPWSSAQVAQRGGHSPPLGPACRSLPGPVHTRGLTRPDLTAPTAGADPFTWFLSSSDT